MDSKEFKTLQENTHELEVALKHNLPPIVDELHNEGFINYEAYQHVKERSSTSKAQIAGELVGSIKDAVELSPKMYHTLIKIFSGKKYYDAIIKKLCRTYRGQCCVLIH